MTQSPPVYAPAPLAPAAAPAPLSIAAFATGIAGLVFGWAFLGLPSIVAVVLGHLALAREPAGRRFALPGLILGYVGIVGTALLVLLIVLALTLPFVFVRLYPAFTGL